MCVSISTTDSVALTLSGETTVTAVFAAGSTATQEQSVPPIGFALDQSYPNPFSESTIIGFAIPAATQVRLAVFDLLGRERSVLIDRKIEAGVHSVQFDGSALAGGLYVYRLVTGLGSASRVMTVLR